MRQFTIWLAASIPLTGCSLVDALQGQPEPPIVDAKMCPDPQNPACSDVEQFTCSTPFVMTDDVGEIIVDGCGQSPSEPPDSCGQGFGEDAVFRLDVRRGMYSVCVTGPPDSSFSLVADCMSPGNDGTCLLINECIDVLVDTGQFAIWHASDLGSCGSITLGLFPQPNLDAAGGGGGSLVP